MIAGNGLTCYVMQADCSLLYDVLLPSGNSYSAMVFLIFCSVFIVTIIVVH